MKLLLLSNSTMKGTPYLDWPKAHLNNFMAGLDKILFIPYAGVTISFDEYTESVQQAIGPTKQVVGIHSIENKKQAIDEAECIAVGGGNTFHLLKKCQEFNLLEKIKAAVVNGTPYMGWSAGSNLACPTIKTTNDMPIVSPNGLDSLGLTSFQINAHYTDRVIQGHGGESRKQRLDELLEVNHNIKVVGLPEGKLLELKNGSWYLKGIESEPAMLFQYGQEPVVLSPGKLSL